MRKVWHDLDAFQCKSNMIFGIELGSIRYPSIWFIFALCPSPLHVNIHDKATNVGLDTSCDSGEPHVARV